MYVIYYPPGASMYKGFVVDNAEIAKKALSVGPEDFAFPSKEWEVYKISEFEPLALRQVREALIVFDVEKKNVCKNLSDLALAFVRTVREALKENEQQTNRMPMDT